MRRAGHKLFSWLADVPSPSYNLHIPPSANTPATVGS